MLRGVLTSFMLPSRILNNARWYLLAAGIAAVLGLLGLLQYRANRQLRDVLGQQMRADVTTSLMRIRSGLEDEFASICNSLALTHPTSSDTDLQQYAEQFSRWRTSADRPDLISGVYFFEIPAASHQQLFQLLPGQTQFQPAEWPLAFSGLKGFLENITHDLGPGFIQHSPERRPHPGEYRHEAHEGFPPWLIDESVPALVQPVPDPGGGHISFLIVELNPKELAQNVLPQLMKHEFAAHRNLNYRVALVTASDHRNVLYSSDPGFGTSPNLVVDAQLNIFGPPMPLAGNPVRRFELPSTDQRRHTQAITSTQIFTQMHGYGGPLRLQRIRPAAEGPGWILIARHSKGSVEAAADALYHRNLTIDFGVLLVLAAMIGTIAISSQRAQRLAQLQMDFVAGVSHELRTPLTGIISSAQNIADGLVISKGRAIQYGQAILGQAQRLAELVEQILLFSATERSPAYNFEWLDVNELIAASLEGTASQLRSAGIRVEESIQPNLTRVRGDFKALTQCLQNLIVNAIKYGGTDPWIGVQACLNTKSGFAHDVVITIEDHGRGIGSDELQKIFDPFYRSPSVTADQIQGSGLGLAIVKKIAEAMGGRLTVESEVGKGSRFSVHLQPEKHFAESGVPESPRAEAADHR
jgi:signal transduction histidine kinase